MVDLITPSEAGALIQGALAVVDPRVRQFTYPLFAVDEYDRPDLYASCVLLDVDDRAVLITAAHAIFEISQCNSRVHAGAADGILAVPPFVMSSKDGRDPLDLAAVRLPDELLQHFRAPLSMSRICGVTEPHVRCIHGYPLTKNVQRKSVDEVRKTFTSYALTYAGASLTLSGAYAKYKKDPAVHIALKYQKKSRNHEGGVAQPPNPHGISGGGLWQIPDIRKPDQFVLEGIAIEFHKRGSLVFATRIEEVVSFVRRYVLV